MFQFTQKSQMLGLLNKFRILTRITNGFEVISQFVSTFEKVCFNPYKQLSFV